ncbi:MAG: glycosyltransferase [Lonepinella koalarum]|nr:glycosyltransferase [Lonepinella koalarum]
MEKKKILVLHVALAVGGAETVLLNYLNILTKNPEYQVDLAVFEGGEKNHLEKIDSSIKVDFLLNEIETQFSRYTYWKSKQSNISDSDRRYYSSWDSHISNTRLERLKNKIKKENYDLIIDFQGIVITFITPEFIKTIKKPIISWIHSDSDFERWEYNVENTKQKLDYISSFVAICMDMKKKYANALENRFLSNKEVYTLYNPLDINKVLNLANEEVSELDQDLLNYPFILQVARLDERQKNHLKMIDLFAKLKEKGIKEKLYIIGNGNSYAILQEKIKELGLENECLLLGSRTNPMPFMRRANLFIHTANYEGLGMVLIESMICGVPVVAFDCPTGPREILADGKYGELIPMGNDELFIEKTYELLSHEEKRQHYISLLPEAVERFSFEQIEHDFFALIEKTISENNSLN